MVNYLQKLKFLLTLPPKKTMWNYNNKNVVYYIKLLQLSP